MSTMSERISELADGELDDAEAMRQITAMKDDAGLRRSWDTYHLIGDAIRGHMGQDLSSKVATRLRDEPAILAPRALVPQLPQVRRWAYSAAAAVAAIAVVAWVAPPMMPSEVAQAPAAKPAPVAEAESATDVENYLLAHQRYSGMAPAVRTVSLEAPREPAGARR